MGILSLFDRKKKKVFKSLRLSFLNNKKVWQNKGKDVDKTCSYKVQTISDKIQRAKQDRNLQRNEPRLKCNTDRGKLSSTTYTTQVTNRHDPWKKTKPLAAAGAHPAMKLAGNCSPGYFKYPSVGFPTLEKWRSVVFKGYLMGKRQTKLFKSSSHLAGVAQWSFNVL